jgi:GNAT superfamily N-acetyltransferase
MSVGLRIEKLRRDHAVDGFDCGQAALNRFLERHALQSQQAGAAMTYLALRDDDVVGFYSLAVGQIDYGEAPDRLIKGLARHPVPIMLLARLAVASRFQGMKLGAGLLKDAMRRTLQASEIAGIGALVVHAKDDQARSFYQRFDFIASPTDAYHLMVLMKDVRALVGEA